jgi:uncharacterized protein (DUF305 family)
MDRTSTPEPDPSAEAQSPGHEAQAVRSVPTGVRRLWAVIAVAALVTAGAIGWIAGSSDRATVTMPDSDSVDAGFARDMSTHHQQAVTMAGYARDNSTDAGVRLFAVDIETWQEFQIGQMQGWLDVWGLPRTAPTAMAWMGTEHARAASALMPGMVTPAQMTELETSHGRALDILFLQLVIHHHQGGVAMATYAMHHAQEPYVRTIAGQMVAGQTGDLIAMEQLLRKLGGIPLPPPET